MSAHRSRGAASIGLCAGCVHARVIENRQGSRFYLCELSRTDARFPKYPPLPVLRCAGFERRAGEAPAGERDASE